MDIKRLNHFIILAEEGRFASAAARVHLSQAAFSRSIQTLEARVGFRLFDRGITGTQLTPAGELLLARARDMVFHSQCLQRDVDLIKHGDAGEIAIGAAPIPAAVIVPDLLCQLQKSSPHLLTRVQLGKLPTLLDQLDAQVLDFCLGDPRFITHHERYHLAHVARQVGGVYCRKMHPLVRRRSSANADTLKEFGVAMISVTPSMMEGISAAFGIPSINDFPQAVECDDMSTLIHLVTQTNLLGILPHALVRRTKNPLHLLNSHNVVPLLAEVHAIWLKGRTLSPSAERAIRVAQAICR